MNDAVAPPPSVPTVPPPPPPAPADVGQPVAFTGVRGDFRWLVIRGAMLELVTLGFYRFWLATDMRRHLWSHTTAGSDAPEYTGTAKELLIGFLFALAILAPVYLAYFLIGLEAELYQAFASIPLVLFFYLFYQFARYRARRYRLTRTVWRGVRFWMKGSGWLYAFLAGLWMVLIIVTAGLALPWSRAALERYKMRNSFYGDLAGDFDGTGGGLFKQAWTLWLAVVLIIGFVVVLGTAAPAAAVLVGALALVFAPFIYAVYKAIEWRWWVSGIRFGAVRFESNLATSALLAPYWAVIGWSLLILVALFAWMFGVGGIIYAMFAKSGATGLEVGAMVAQSPLVIGLVVLGYLVCALAFGVVVRIYLRRDVWARVVASTMVYNLAATDNVVARGEAANALGEGFADGLDIGGF
ncbi:MAG: DUF898 domain-containing protein [Xanthobacteraceae bacterium]|nr:DUF898 domain-containing protein [Xanthobacteraceae bacterium]